MGGREKLNFEKTKSDMNLLKERPKLRNSFFFRGLKFIFRN